VRAVNQTEMRLKEAAKLGFSAAWVPPRRTGVYDGPLKLTVIPQLSDLVARIGGDAVPTRISAAGGEAR
jgi:predicted ATP-dependent serine protease